MAVAPSQLHFHALPLLLDRGPMMLCYSRRRSCGTVVMLAFAVAPAALASPVARAAIDLDFATVVELSVKGGDVVLAERGVDEARAELVGADVWLTENPNVEVVAGPRATVENTFIPEAGAELSVPLEVYGQRGLRVDAASREVAARQALVADARRRVGGEALMAYLESLYTRELRVLAEERASVAAELLKATQLKRKAGDVGDVDVSLIALEDARARRATINAASEHERAVAHLRLVLLLDPVEPINLKENLQAAVARFRGGESPAPTPPVERPDVVAAALSAEAARAGLAAEERAAWPVAALGLGYEHEEGEHVGLIGLTIPIGLFQRNQGGVAVAQARIALRDAERSLLQQRVTTELSTASRRLTAARAGLDILEESATPRIDEGVELSRRAYSLGERSLTDVLVVQRETLDAKHDVQEARLELGIAGVESLVATGVLQ